MSSPLQPSGTAAAIMGGPILEEAYSGLSGLDVSQMDQITQVISLGSSAPMSPVSIIHHTSRVLDGVVIGVTDIQALLDLGEQGKGFLGYEPGGHDVGVPKDFFPGASIQLCNLVPTNELWFLDHRGYRMKVKLLWKEPKPELSTEAYLSEEDSDDAWFDIREV